MILVYWIAFMGALGFGAQSSVTPPAKVSVGGPFLEDVEGVSGVITRGLSGAIKNRKKRDQLEIGDVFLTGAKGQLRLSFEYGTQVLVAPNSQLQVSMIPRVQENEFLDVPLITLKYGEIRVLVEAPSEQLREGVSTHPYKFYVSTPNLYLGVRGTDFLVRVNPDETQVHTARGWVEVGRNLPDLKAGKVEVVKAETYTRGFTKTGRIIPPLSFLLAERIKEFESIYPRMEYLYNMAVKDNKDKVITTKFAQLREKQTALFQVQTGIKAPTVDAKKVFNNAVNADIEDRAYRTKKHWRRHRNTH